MRRCAAGRSILHVTLTRVSTADQPIATATVVADEMQRWLRDIDGFEGFLMLSREGTTIGISVWTSREVADRHRTARIAFIERVSAIAGVRIEEMADYEVAFAHLGPLRENSSD